MMKRFINVGEPVERWLPILMTDNNLCKGSILKAIKLIHSEEAIVKMLANRNFRSMEYVFDYLPGTLVTQVETYLGVDLPQGYGVATLVIQDIGDIGELSTTVSLNRFPNNALKPLLNVIKVCELKKVTVTYNVTMGVTLTATGEVGLEAIINIMNSIQESYRINKPTFVRTFENRR